MTTAGAQTYSNPNGTTFVTADLTATDDPVTFTDAVILNAGLTLSAGSDIVSFAGGVVVNPGALMVAGGLVFSDSATFSATLNGTDPDSYSQVTASGPVDLGGSTLNLTLGFTPDLGEAFTLLSSDAGPITGTFAGLDEGAVFAQDGLLFQITYQGGASGNSVVVTCVAGSGPRSVARRGGAHRDAFAFYASAVEDDGAVPRRRHGAEGKDAFFASLSP